MPRRPAPTIRPLAPRAPRRRPDAPGGPDLSRRLAAVRLGQGAASLHPLTDSAANAALETYDRGVKEAFDRIVPVLKRL